VMLLLLSIIILELILLKLIDYNIASVFYFMINE
jgi:hypothetical protein